MTLDRKMLADLAARAAGVRRRSPAREGRPSSNARARRRVESLPLDDARSHRRRLEEAVETELPLGLDFALRARRSRDRYLGRKGGARISGLYGAEPAPRRRQGELGAWPTS